MRSTGASPVGGGGFILGDGIGDLAGVFSLEQRPDAAATCYFASWTVL